MLIILKNAKNESGLSGYCCYQLFKIIQRCFRSGGIFELVTQSNVEGEPVSGIKLGPDFVPISAFRWAGRVKNNAHCSRSLRASKLI